jgi:predicted Zn-dependent peptidase
VINDEAHIFYVTAGIDKDKANKVVKLIKQALCEIENGIIDEEDIENAKTNFVEQNKSVEENSSVLICNMQDVIILNYDNVEVSSKRIKEVTVDDIKDFARKMKIEVIYMLHGGDINEKN